MNMAGVWEDGVRKEAKEESGNSKDPNRKF